MTDIFRIRLQGHLNDRWSDWLQGLEIQRQEDGTTLLLGALPDQSALHGVLTRIRDLGLPLLSVNRNKQAPDDDSPTSRSGVP